MITPSLHPATPSPASGRRSGCSGSTRRPTGRRAARRVKKAAATAKSGKERRGGSEEDREFIARHKKVFLIIGGIGLVLVLLLGRYNPAPPCSAEACPTLWPPPISPRMLICWRRRQPTAPKRTSCGSTWKPTRQTHDYDEYHYDLDEIEHDPYVLLSILSALHEGMFTIDQVQGDLQMLFDKQYILTETVAVETAATSRRIPGRTSEGNTYTESYRVYYNYYICTVKLENFDLSHVPVYMMDEETLSMYAVYMSTLGNRPDLFPSSGYVPKYMTNPPTKYEIPRILTDERFAALITEAEKYLGYPYVWGGSSPYHLL